MEHRITAEELKALDGCPLTIRINSSGGSVFAAHAIHNLIKAYAGPVTVVIDGIAASAASIIAVAAKKIIMPANSMMMIHDPMVALKGYHNAEELKSCLDALAATKDSIVSAYLGRSKVSAEALSSFTIRRKWSIVLPGHFNKPDVIFFRIIVQNKFFHNAVPARQRVERNHQKCKKQYGPEVWSAHRYACRIDQGRYGFYDTAKMEHRITVSVLTTLVRL